MNALHAVRLAGVLPAMMVCGFGLAAAPLQPDLKVGDRAPALEPMQWIKGSPVSRFEPGHVYVVEFWATWCVPCKEIMPELSALQRRHAGRLTVIGVDVREAERGEAQIEAVKKFVAKQGKNMDYVVAMDDPQKKTIFNSWMTAAGAYGIPASFIVDGKGRMVWIGNPIGSWKQAFTAAVEQALAGKSDLAAARKIQEEVNRQTAVSLGGI
jgi:thiol-disulfide isomerase/thioredoxin